MNGQAFSIRDVLAERGPGGERYHEFLRVSALSAGMYVLPVCGTDPQAPHAQDEVYYVVRGRAALRVGTDDVAVAPGSIVYVPARVTHRFHTITEELEVLVFFAPAESLGGGGC